MESHAWLHVLLSNQIKIGHATAWMRARVCASFMLPPSLLPFGFAPSFARILRDGTRRRAGTFQSRCQLHRKRESQDHVTDRTKTATTEPNRILLPSFNSASVIQTPLIC